MQANGYGAKGMNILAIDPSSTVSGYAIFSEGELKDIGEIDATKVEYSRRYMHITGELDKLRKDYGIADVACERAIRFDGKKVPALEVAVMSIKKWAQRLKIPIAFYSATEWKKSVIGDAQADKEAVARVIHLQYRDFSEPLSNHITDAIAIGLHHVGIRKWESMSAGG